MTADVTSQIRMINGGDANDSATAKSTAPITRDLLGGCCTVDSKELDLDLQVPCGWEKRLDLKSGKVYIQRCNSISENNKHTKPPTPNLQDLNFPPSKTLNLFDESTLDLKLVSPFSSTSSSTTCNYQSICTLDKIKSALERAEKDNLLRKRSLSMSMSMSMSVSKSSSSPHSTSSSSIRDSDLDQEERSNTTIATACPVCLLYVLIARDNPRCPRCNNSVSLPMEGKKPRIDLNMCI